jgi:hypothetical protein
MEIIDIDQYVKNITGLQGSNGSLGNDDEAFLTKLMGEATSLTNHVENISSFAGSSTRQLFYELLQNANDVKATHFGVGYDDSSILIVNNGAPFRLLPSGEDAKKDDLRAFLAKGKGTKYDDKETIGKYGQGSKLLYNLLTDRSDRNQQEALGQAIIEEYKGIILFSWSSSIQRQALMTYYEGQSIGFKSDVYNSDFPILLKIVLTYFPVLPGKDYEIKSSSEVLFPLSELEVFSRTLNNYFSATHIIESDFDKGSALFILLGEGKGNTIRDAVDENLIDGVRTSLPLLNQNIKSVQFNQTRVSKSSAFHEADLSILEDKTARIFWPKSLSQLQGGLVNFFQFFPITNEVHGLNLIIDSREFNIAGSRQNLDFESDYTKLVLKEISGAFIAHIRLLGRTEKESELIALLKAVVKSSPAGETENNRKVKALFYDALIPALKENIPTTRGIRNSLDANCVINTSKVKVDTATLGIENQFWVNDGLQDMVSELSSVLGIKIWGISNILKAFTSSDARDEWVNNLPEQDYQNIIEELKGLSPARIRELPFLKFSDRKAYSFNQALDSELLVLLDEKAYPIKEILIKCGFTVGGREVMQGGEKGLLEKLASSIPNPLTRWKAIRAKIDAASLLHTEKWQIFRTLRDNWGVPEEYLGDELLLFKNREGVLQPLSKMLKPGHSHAPSGILKPFELFPTEVYKVLDPYLMESKHIWNTLTQNWEKIKPEISLQNYMQVLKDLGQLFRDKESGIKLQDQAWLMNQDGNLVSRGNIFYSTSIAALPQDQYSGLYALIERITDNLNLVLFSFLEQLDQINFAELPNSSLRNLAEKISKDNSRISPSEAKLLFGLKSNQEYFFSTFKIRKVDETILLVNNQSGIQFHANDAKLSYFLKGKSNYFELPQPLYETFKEDGGLKRDHGSGVDEFARKLMTDFGAQKEFIDLVLRCNQETQLLYLNRIQRFDLSTQNNIGEYGPGSFEVKLIDLANRLNQLENLRTKTYVDGLPLGSLTYEDRVLLKGNGLKFHFRLSDLITEYAAQATTINRLLDKFTNRFNATTFLETRSYPEGDIFNKILRDEDLSNPERVSFIAAYLLTQSVDHNDQNLRNLDWLSLNKADVLSSLYGHEMVSFEQIIGSYYWNPANHIDAPDDGSFLLESEKLPAWAKEWLGVNQERLKFLKAAGLRTVDDPTLVFRRAVLSGESLSGTAIADAANQPQPENTLKWLLGRNHISEYGSASHRLINNYIDKLAVESDALPPYLQRFNTNGRLTIQEMTPPYNALSLSGGINEEDLSIFPDVVSKTDRALVDIDLLSTDIQKRLEENGISPAFLEKEISDQRANDLQEWNLAKYKEWKKDYDKYSIRVTRIAVPLTYYLKYGEEEKEISVRSIETSIRHNRRDGHVDLIVFREENKSVIEAIQEAKEELFEDDYKPLADLLAKFAVNDEDQLILDIIKDNEVTKEELEEMLRKGSLVKEPPPTYQEGSPDGTRVKIDITEEERQKIENSSEAIKKMLNQATESELNEISQRLQEVKDFMEGTEHKSSPSLLIGYIGEVLVVEWLKRINSTLSVDHVTISNQNGKIEQKYTAYDILVKHGTQKFEIDVKTTIKPLEEVSKSVAFYVSKRQYDHIAENPDNNYFIFRISLKELGLEPFYQELKRRNPNMNYEELINKEDADIRREINEFLSDPLKVSLLREHRMYFKLSVPKMSNLEVPF